MNWASASMMANVDKIILEEGFGCNVEIVPGDTMPTFASMNEKGEPHLVTRNVDKCICCCAWSSTR